MNGFRIDVQIHYSKLLIVQNDILIQRMLHINGLLNIVFTLCRT